MNMLGPRFARYGVLLLRISLGSMWISHALLKYFVFTMPGLTKWLSVQGLPGMIAWPLVLLELIGGIAMISGIYARHIALLLIPILLGATWIHSANGWVFSNAGGGWEYPVFLILASVSFGLIDQSAFTQTPRPELIQ